MVEKHINRKDDNEQDESSHITELGPKLDVIDPLAVVARTIVFGKSASNAAKEDLVKEKAEEFKDQMNNTNQYLKFINAHLAARKSKIEKIREQEKRFEEEVEALQEGKVKSRPELDKINYKYINENDTKSLLAHLETEKQMMCEKLGHQQEQIEKTRQQIQEKEEQIAQLQNEIEMLSQKKAEPAHDPISVLKEELAKLGISGDSTRIFDAVNSIASMLDGKKTESKN